MPHESNNSELLTPELRKKVLAKVYQYLLSLPDPRESATNIGVENLDKASDHSSEAQGLNQEGGKAYS